MNENMNAGQNSEEIKKQQEKEDSEYLADYFARHPESVVSPENLKENAPEIAEFKNMIVSFESIHSLIKLRAIVDLSLDLATLFKYSDDIVSEKLIEDAIRTYEKYNPGYVEVYKKKIAEVKAIVLVPEDTEKFKIRIAAKKDLAPIVASLNSLKGNKDYEKFKTEYMRLARAVGTINNNKVDHK